ncbi:UNVERIFIED_CONTAM: branched-chain-amino-acid aminotransferase, partial [Gekko kuhli]
MRERKIFGDKPRNDIRPILETPPWHSTQNAVTMSVVHGMAAGNWGYRAGGLHVEQETRQPCLAADLIINPSATFKEKPDPKGLVFGTVFSDNMLFIEWSADSGWEKPQVKPLENLSVHPAISAFHYAVELFEGMKAYRGVDGKIRLFRPRLNMDRMLRSAIRATLPGFDKEELLECIRKLVEVEKEWVPYSSSASLYIRPTLIGTEPSLGVKKPSKALLYVILSPVGPYFASGSFNPISLWADPKYVRAWKGGTGDCKLGG